MKAAFLWLGGWKGIQESVQIVRLYGHDGYAFNEDLAPPGIIALQDFSSLGCVIGSVLTAALYHGAMPPLRLNVKSWA
jgi:hypothetical protein